MAQKRYLNNAPIREALLDIQFEPATTFERLREWTESWAASAAGKASDVVESLIRVSASDAEVTKSAAVPVGRRVDLRAEGHVVQFRQTGFTFSRLPKYAGWEAMSARAYDVWRAYSEVVGPVVVTKLAVRYINALDLPLPIDDFADYLVCPPDVPETLPQAILGSLSRVVVSYPVPGRAAIVTQNIEGVDYTKNKLRFLLDVDVVQNCRIDAGNFDAIAKTLGELRDIKNDVFFSFLHEPALEPYA